MRTFVTPVSLFFGVVGFAAVSVLPLGARAADAGETGPLPVATGGAAFKETIFDHDVALDTGPREWSVAPGVAVAEVADAGNHELIADARLSETAPTPMGGQPILLAQALEDDANDPLEPVNRAIFEFNQVIYDALFTPIAKAYNDAVPALVRSSLGNVIDNIASPITLANDLLQLEFTRALTTLARFVVNTIAGIGGMGDVATGIGLKPHTEDFGQTLGSYGMGEGLYLVLPLLGPSNPRDAVGKFLVDPYFDPLGLYLDNTDQDTAIYVRTGVNALDEYASMVGELEKIRRTSVDYYAAIRSLYRQKRAAEIANGREENMPPIPDYDLNFAPASDNPVAGVK